MISGLVVRNFKIYKGFNFIPISNGTDFNGLIGANGVGKSSVLEAFDCFFNGKPWIKNIDTDSLSNSWVIPVFTFGNDEINWGDSEAFVKNVTSYVKDILDRELSTDVSTKNYERPTKDLKEHIHSYFREYDIIIPICLTGENRVTSGIFNTADFKNFIKRIEGFEEADTDLMFYKAYCALREQLTYVYIPKDIEADRLVRFENEDIQHLFDSNLYKKVSGILTNEDIKRISTNLKSYIEEISSKIDGYRFKARTSYQPNLKSYKIYSLIIEEFFSLRELFKITKDGKDIPLGQLSSGEKQQALISLIYYIVTEYRTRNKNLIIAVDEPEASLHVALCYEQFEKLFKVSERCSQVLFTSHWYGFIPTLVEGCFNHITQLESGHTCTLFNVEQYREEIKHKDAECKGQLPIDIMLKSTNDLVQSILSSIIKEDSYNWLICEGSSDRIYLDAYMHEEVMGKKLRIVPVCKAKEIKKIYNQLCSALEDLKDDAKGKVFLLTDTDSQALSCTTNRKLDSIVRWRRIVNDESKKQTLLVKVDSDVNPKAPKTDIEDTLNGKIFGLTINTFRAQYPDLSFISEDEKGEIPSSLALDLRPSEYLKLDDFFNNNKGDNKVLFARKYVEIMINGEYKIPSWINEIKNFYS